MARPAAPYVYFTYGNYWMFNIVCEPEGDPAAMLVRARNRWRGLDEMAARRPGRAPVEWTSGPAKLVWPSPSAARTTRLDLTTPANNLWLEPGDPCPTTGAHRPARGHGPNAGAVALDALALVGGGQ